MKRMNITARTLLGLSFAILLFPWASFGQDQMASEQPAQSEFREILSLIDQIEDSSPQSRNLLAELRGKLHRREREALSHPQSRVSGCAALAQTGLRADDREPAPGSNLYSSCAGLTDEALIAKLAEIVGNHTSVDYREARRHIFTNIDNHNGMVECVYTGRVEPCNSIPNPNNMNTEHTWPQSHGATGVAKSDIHHLFPTDSQANSTRGSLPFGEVTNAVWSEGQSECDQEVFEVRPAHRGNVARAIFYFAVRYGKSIDADEEATLRHWHQEDAVDDAERERCNKIENVQHNRNPFVDRPDFVDMIRDF